MNERCWEAKNCRQAGCAMRRRKDRHCWLSGPRVCFDGELRSFRNRLCQCCNSCMYFHQSLDRSTGRRASERILCETLYKALDEMGGSNSELVEINQALKQKIRSQSMLDQVSNALQSTMDQDQIFHVILTGITSAEILGLNRAFLFLVDRDRTSLAGALGVGPAGPEEAGKMRNGKDRSFIELAQTPHAEACGNEHATGLARRMWVPLDDSENIFARAVREKKSFLITDAAADPAAAAIGAHFGVNAFAVVPLVTEGEALGLLMADNAATGLPVSEADLVLMGIFAGQAAAAIRNARLYARLKEKMRELAESQEQLLRAERMAAAGGITAGLIREIWAPLVSIDGRISVLSALLTAGHPGQDQLEIIRTEVGQLEGALVKALDVKQYRDPVLAQADIAAIVADCAGQLAPEFKSRGIETRIDIAPRLPMVWLDAQQFPRVLLQILKNAIQSMPDGGLVTISARPAENGIALSITDTGAGIPPADLDRVFTPHGDFFDIGPGTGLAVYKKIMEGHGGTISAVAHEPKGTTILINIPARI